MCEGEAPRQPCITEEGTRNVCGKKTKLAERKPEKWDKEVANKTEYLTIFGSG